MEIFWFITSIVFVVFVLYHFFKSTRPWSVVANPIGFIILTYVLTTQLWAPTIPRNFESVFVAFAVTILSGRGGLYGWATFILFVGATIPLFIFGIGFVLKGMYEEDEW